MEKVSRKLSQSKFSQVFILVKRINPYGVWDIFGFTYSDRHSISLDISVARQSLVLVRNSNFRENTVGSKTFLRRKYVLYDHFIDTGQRKTLFMVRKQTGYKHQT